MGDDQTLGGGLRRSLLSKLASAETAYRSGRPCTAANILGAYIHETEAIGSPLSTRGMKCSRLPMRSLSPSKVVTW